MNGITRRTGWRALTEWAIAFATLAFAVIAAMSIGMVVLPVALGLLALAAFRNRLWPESLFGAFVGAGATLLVIAFLNRDHTPCPPQGTMISLAPGQSFACGGFSPTPWLIVGLLAAALGISGYFLARRR